MTQSLESLLRSSLKAPSGPRLRRTSQLLSLEQRFMFDGAAVVDAAHAAQAPDAAVAAVPPAVTVREAEPAKDSGKKEVALVDTSVANYKALEAGVRDGVGIVEFDGNKDGLAQIAAWASTQSGLDAIHILSHGSEGVLNLGASQLTQRSLSDSTTQAELAQLGQALTADGDLLLYGCDVGAGDGAALLSGLAQATGADVAASTDLTGAARLGGNWTLEAHSGVIDTRELALVQYDGVLDTVYFTGAESNYDYTNITIDRLVSNASGSGNSTVHIYFQADNMGFDAAGGLYPYNASIGFGNGTRLVITAENGYTFGLTGLTAQAWTGTLHFTLTYANGSTSNFDQGGVDPYMMVPIWSFNQSINDVVRVTIDSNDYSIFQNFIITDVKLASPVATVSSASLSADTGTSASDFVTNIASQTISGSLSTALGTGERVQVSYDNGSTWNNASSYAVGSTNWSTTTTLAGSNTFMARVINTNATSSTAYSHTYRLDTTAPTTTLSNLALSADTGTSTTDFITKTASQTISATLSNTLAAGDVLYGSLDNGVTFTDITSKVSGTTLTWNGATLSSSNTLMLRVTDSAGNNGVVTSRAYTLDTTAPANSIASASFSNDSGTSSTDFITNTAAQTVSGTLSGNLAAGDTVYVSLNNGATWTTASASVGSNVWSLAGVTLTSSSTLRVKVSDTAGNDGAVLSQAYVYDTSAPTTTFSGLSFSNDTGTAGDLITNSASQTLQATLSGALAAGDILYGSLDNGSTFTDITSKVSGTTLNWNGITLTASNTLQLKLVDAAGNQGAVRSQAYVLDSSAPAAPTITLATASDSGMANSDGVTNDSTPMLTGTAESGSTVSIYDGATLLGSVVATGGAWSYTTGVRSDGGHVFTATATDSAGNVSAASSAAQVTVDTIGPAVGSVAVPANGTYYSASALNFTVHFNEAVYVDTTGGTPRIAIVIGATTRYASYVSGSGGSALVFSYTVANGDIDSNGITVGALDLNGGSLRDPAGNDASTTLNSVGSTAGVGVDGSSPSISSISASTADGAYGSGQTITLTVDFSTAVTVDTTGGTPTLALDGGGTATYTGGSGTNTLTFSYTVGAGQNSADLDYSSTSALALNGATIIDAGGAHQPAVLTLATPGTAGSLGANKDIVIDTAAPTNTAASAVFSADTGTSAVDLVTRAAAQTISGTLAANLASGEHVYVSLDNGATWSLATTSVGSSTWTLAGQTLTGSGTLKVRVSDDAGNNGASYSQAYVLDTTAPTITFSSLSLSADTGISHSDFITNTAAQTISATLSAALAAGDVVYGSLDNGATWTDITSKVSGTTLTWNGVTLAASDTLKLRVTDLAGNNGVATSRAYVLDTTGPSTTVATVGLSNDSGSSTSDFITNVAAQSISGTLSANLVSGEVVYVSLDNGATWTAASTTVGSNAFQLNGQTLTASNTLLVKVSDAAGNDGAALSQAYVYDTAATVPSIDPQSTASLTPVLTGSATLAAGETLTVSVGGATYDVTPVAGAWRLDLATAVPASGALALALNQQYDVVARVTDLAGNTASDTTAGELIVGTLTPGTLVSSINFSQDSGASSSDFITNVAAQTISGTLSANLGNNERVLVSLDNGATWTTASASVGADTWSLSGQTLTASNTLLVKVSNLVGNDGAVRSQAYVYHTTASVPSVDAQTTTSTTPTLTGSVTLAPDEHLTVSVGGATYDVTPVAGAWRLDLATAVPASGRLNLAPGQQYNVVATVTDLAGNVATDSSNGELVVSNAVTAPALFQTPPVVPVPMPSVVYPASLLPPSLSDQSAPPPPALSVASQSPWQSPGLFGQTLQADAPIRGGLAELLGPDVSAPLSVGREVLVASRPIDNLVMRSGERISVQLDTHAFSHSIAGERLQLSAELEDGRPLPPWLKFNPRNGRFEGIAPEGFAGKLTVRVMARDSLGHEAVQAFDIVIQRDHRAQAPVGRNPAATVAEPTGRSSLSQQLHDARTTSGQRLAGLAQSAGVPGRPL